MKFFLEFLQSHLKLKSNLQDFVSEVCHTKHYKAGTPILSPGEIQENIYFIQEGVIRAYAVMDEYEWTN
jgi:CRP-like cAMP-binding protein